MNGHAKPQFLDELIGQEPIKEQARVAIGAALARSEPLRHTLLTSSGGGLGKTTMAGILANEMHVGMVAASGPAISTISDLWPALIDLDPRWVLHIDEIHAMGRKVANELLLVLEEGVIHLPIAGRVGPRPLPPFTLVGSTTEPSKLSEPLRQRFAIQFHFEFYSAAELTQIARAFSARLAVSFADDVCQAIAEHSLGIPRICRHLVERVQDVATVCVAKHATMAHFTRAVELEGIDRLGLRAQHRAFLAVMKSAAPRPVSAATLAKALGIELKTVTDVLEPPIIRLGLATIGPGGRRLTPAGEEHLDTVETDAHSTSIVWAKLEHSSGISGATPWKPNQN